MLFKIDPLIFRTWLNILAKVPNSILWLLRFPAPGEAHLKQTATQWANEEVASRIVFTDVSPVREYFFVSSEGSCCTETTPYRARSYRRSLPRFHRGTAARKLRGTELDTHTEFAPGRRSHDQCRVSFDYTIRLLLAEATQCPLVRHTCAYIPATQA